MQTQPSLFFHSHASFLSHPLIKTLSDILYIMSPFIVPCIFFNSQKFPFVKHLPTAGSVRDGMWEHIHVLQRYAV